MTIVECRAFVNVKFFCCENIITFNWRASSYPDFFQNYFLFFDNPDKCRKPGFLRGNIYTSCIFMVLLDNFANKDNSFLFPSLSLALPFPPWVSTSSNPGFQDCTIKGTLVPLAKDIYRRAFKWHFS